MANIGDLFTDPDIGFKRYVYNQSKKDLFYMNNMTNVRTWGVFGTYKTDTSVTFYIKNATVIRFINLVESSCGIANIYMNNVYTAPYYSTFLGTQWNSNSGYNRMVAEIFPDTAIVKITILNNGPKNTQMNFAAIDVNEGAELISKEEYDDLMSIKMLIKDNDKYYTIINNSLSEITRDYITEISSNGFENIADITPEIRSLLHPGWKLIANKNSKLTINAIKSKSELVISTKINSLKIANNIYSIFANCKNINEDNQVKIVFSTDNGLTWNSWNFETDSIIPLTNTITKKDYNSMTNEEKTIWENLKLEILSIGIPYNKLKDIDFSDKKDNNIEFAIVLFGEESFNASIDSINIDFDEFIGYKVLASEDISVSIVPEKYIKLVPKRNLKDVEIHVVTSSNV